MRIPHPRELSILLLILFLFFSRSGSLFLSVSRSPFLFNLLAVSNEISRKSSLAYIVILSLPCAAMLAGLNVTKIAARGEELHPAICGL